MMDVSIDNGGVIATQPTRSFSLKTTNSELSAKYLFPFIVLGAVLTHISTTPTLYTGFNFPCHTKRENYDVPEPLEEVEDLISVFRGS